MSLHLDTWLWLTRSTSVTAMQQSAVQQSAMQPRTGSCLYKHYYPHHPNTGEQTQTLLRWPSG